MFCIFTFEMIFFSFAGRVSNQLNSGKNPTIQISWLVLFITSKCVEPCKFTFLYPLIVIDKWKILFIFLWNTGYCNCFRCFHSKQFNNYKSSNFTLIHENNVCCISVCIWLVYHFILLNKMHTYFIFNIVKTWFSIPSFTFILGFYFFFLFLFQCGLKIMIKSIFFTIDDDSDLVKYGSYLFDKTSYSSFFCY